MSPIVEKTGRFYLDKIEETKLHLTWLSCKDFSSLNDSVNQTLLKETWINIKSELRAYFKNNVISLQSIVKTFKRIIITIDPRLPCAYDPEKDVLIFNLWSLFFTLTNDGFATPVPPWDAAGQLVHEFDHYLYFKENDMIGKREKDYEEFDKENLCHLEKRAYSNQKTFLEKCKNKVPFETLMYKIKIRNWSQDGKFIDFEAPIIQMCKEKMKDSIDHAICQISNIVDSIDTGKRYDVLSTEDSVNKHSKMIEILSLPIKLDREKKDYPKIEIKM